MLVCSSKGCYGEFTEKKDSRLQKHHPTGSAAERAVWRNPDEWARRWGSWWFVGCDRLSYLFMPFFFSKTTFEARKRLTKHKFKTMLLLAAELKWALKSCVSHQVANTTHTTTFREWKNLLCSVNEDYVSLRARGESIFHLPNEHTTEIFFSSGTEPCLCISEYGYSCGGELG